MARNITSYTIASGKFLELKELEFINDDGKILKWEAVQRRGNKQAVSVITIKVPTTDSGWSIVLVRQFRPPTGKYCIENPAGIIDEGETIEQAALRELKEETGYTGRIVFTGYPTESSAGMTGELVTPVVAVVDDTEENRHPIQHLDNAECIKIIELPADNLEEQLKKMHDAGDCISGRLVNMLIGLKLSGIISKWSY